jgi:hypothetical protein
MITHKQSWLRNAVASIALRLGFDRLALFALDIRVDGLPAWRAKISRTFSDSEDVVLSYSFTDNKAPHILDGDDPIDLSDPRIQ